MPCCSEEHLLDRQAASWAATLDISSLVLCHLNGGGGCRGGGGGGGGRSGSSGSNGSNSSKAATKCPSDGFSEQW